VLAAKSYSYIHTAHPDSALKCLEEAQRVLSAHPEIGDQNQKLEIYGLLSIAQLHALEFDRALESAERALELSRKEYPSVYHAFSGYSGPAEVSLTLWERGHQHADISGLAWRACRELRRYARIFPIGEPRFRLSEGRHYWLSGKYTKAREAWERSLAAATRLSMLNEQALACYEIARHLELNNPERRIYLERARETFALCGGDYVQVLADETILQAGW
jgi:tetratricopeptide (TPR) repeat protein